MFHWAVLPKELKDVRKHSCYLDLGEVHSSCGKGDSSWRGETLMRKGEPSERCHNQSTVKASLELVVVAAVPWLLYQVSLSSSFVWFPSPNHKNCLPFFLRLASSPFSLFWSLPACHVSIPIQGCPPQVTEHITIWWRCSTLLCRFQ